MNYEVYLADLQKGEKYLVVFSKVNSLKKEKTERVKNKSIRMRKEKNRNGKYREIQQVLV